MFWIFGRWLRKKQLCFFNMFFSRNLWGKDSRFQEGLVQPPTRRCGSESRGTDRVSQEDSVFFSLRVAVGPSKKEAEGLLLFFFHFLQW